MRNNGTVNEEAGGIWTWLWPF